MKKLIVLFFLISSQLSFGQNYSSKSINFNKNFSLKKNNSDEETLYFNAKLTYFYWSEESHGPGITAELQYNFTNSFAWIITANHIIINNETGNFSENDLSLGPKIYLGQNDIFRTYITTEAGITFIVGENTSTQVFATLRPSFGGEYKISSRIKLNAELKPTVYLFAYGYLPFLAISFNSGINIKLF